MTKREEIREGVAEKIFEWYQRQFNLPILKWGKIHGGIRGLILSITDIVLEYETSQGVVIKVDRELPPNLWRHTYKEGQYSMLEDGYVAVEPLVEE